MDPIPIFVTVKWFLLPIGAFAAAAAVYLGVSVFVISATLTVKRSSCPYRTPTGSGIEEVHFESDGDRIPLAGWFLSSTGDRGIVLVHGLGSHSGEGDLADIARAYVQAGFHVLAFDLRAHGRSGGERLGLGWDERRDVRAAVNLLLRRGFKPGKLGLHGISYGAATALLSAAVIPDVGAVVADSAFADARDVIDGEIERTTGVPAGVSRLLRPGFALVAGLFYSLDFHAIQPERAVPTIAPRPILFIHGSKDQVIPVEHSRRLIVASNNPANELWILPGMGHTEGVRLLGEPCKEREPSPFREEYLKKVTEFFDRWLG